MYSKQALGNYTIEALFLQFAARQHFFDDKLLWTQSELITRLVNAIRFWTRWKIPKLNGALGIYRENLNSRPARWRQLIKIVTQPRQSEIVINQNQSKEKKTKVQINATIARAFVPEAHCIKLLLSHRVQRAWHTCKRPWWRVSLNVEDTQIVASRAAPTARVEYIAFSKPE